MGMQHWQGKESRWGGRVQVDIPVELSANALSGVEGRIKNLSLSGALVEAEADLGLHALVHIRIKIPTSLQQAERIAGYVSRKTKNDVGIEWCEFAPKVVKEFLRLPLNARAVLEYGVMSFT